MRYRLKFHHSSQQLRILCRYHSSLSWRVKVDKVLKPWRLAHSHILTLQLHCLLNTCPASARSPKPPRTRCRDPRNALQTSSSNCASANKMQIPLLSVKMPHRPTRLSFLPQRAPASIRQDTIKRHPLDHLDINIQPRMHHSIL